MDSATEELLAGSEGAATTRRTRRVVLVAFVLLMVPLLAVAGYLGWLTHTVTSNIQQEDLLPDSRLLAPGESPTSVADGQPTPVVQGLGTNYLVIGSDARPGLVGGRADVMVLVHVPVDHSQLFLVHFPRDLYVEIPGHGRDKLNAALAYGGVPLLVTSMEQLLGVRIDHAAKIGFEGFKNMVDAVGGVTVNVEEPSTGGGYDFTAGTMTMDGEMALAFVRERKDLSEGDISRGRRQMEVIKAIALQGLSPDTLLNPIRLQSFLDAATSNLTVDQNLSVNDLRDEAFSLRNVRGSDISFITAPYGATGLTDTGAWVEYVNQAKMGELGAALRDDRMSQYLQ